MHSFDISLEFLKFIHYTISQWIFYKISTQMSIQALFFFILFVFVKFDYIIAH
jgi:hypothetical protein